MNVWRHRVDVILISNRPLRSISESQLKPAKKKEDLYFNWNPKSRYELTNRMSGILMMFKESNGEQRCCLAEMDA